MKKVLIILIAFIGLFTLEFILDFGIVKILCWAFNFTFNWKMVIGFWLLSCLISGLVKKNRRD